MRFGARVLVAVSCTAGAASAPQAYEAVEFAKAGAVHGVVQLEGEVPALAGVDVGRDQAVCGKHISARSIQVGAGGGLANVAVWISDIEAGRAIDTARESKIDNVRCQFEPHVQTLSVGQTLVLRNSDPILHNTHAYVLEGEGNLFNLALPTQGKEIRKPMKRAGLHEVKCDAGHTWMQAFFHVFDHPYHATTDGGGKFEIADLPPGRYTLRAWHETLGSTEIAVQVKAGQTTTLPAIVFRAKE